MCRCFLDDFFPVLRGDGALVLADDEEVQRIALRGCLLDEVAVAVGHGIAVHYSRADGALCVRKAHTFDPRLKAAAPVLHQKDAVRARDFMKADAAKLSDIFRLGI